jgi:uncharacterized membrane protein
VLEFRPPHGAGYSALQTLLPNFVSYVLSFVFLGIYWVNHHHLMQVVQKVNGAILWANLHLLFWLSLTPFVTAWMGENGFAALPVALYGVVLLFAGFSYFILVKVLIAHHGENSPLVKAIGKDFKGKISIALYAVAIPVSFFFPWIAYGVYILVAIMWLIPDQRIEKTFVS